MIAWPSSRSWWIRASSAFVSLSDSAVVGSSKMSTRGDAPSTFAISTSCWVASDSVADLRARVEPVEADALEHRLRLTAQLRRAGDAAAGGQLPHQEVLADRQVGQEAELLVDDADARPRGPGPATESPMSSPSIRYSPESRRIAPVRILISVLLPAPFSPARHMTSPARSSNVTPASAWIGPYALAASRS